MKTYLLPTLKFVLPLVFVGWLLWQIPSEQLEQVAARPKHWGFLAAGFCLALVTVLASFVRWYWLVRALDLRFTLADAMRLGFLGYMFNFVSAGGFGGDLFKAVFVAREQPERRAEAVATVLVDRVVGLYGLLVVATAAVLLGGQAPSLPTRWGTFSLGYVLVGLTALGGIGILVMMTPGFSQLDLSKRLEHVPWVGHLIHRLLSALRMFRRRKALVACILLISVAIHIGSASSFYFLAAGLYPNAPSWRDQLIAVPLAITINALAFFTPGGMGALELALDQLYRIIPHTPTDAAGVVVALAYRLATIGVALVGVVYYWVGRRDVARLIQEAQQAGS